MSQKNKKNPAHFFFLLLNHEVHFYCTKFPSCIFLVYNNESFSMEGLSLLLRNMKRILRYRGESRNQKDNQKVLQVPPCTLEHGFLYPSLLWKKNNLKKLYATCWEHCYFSCFCNCDCLSSKWSQLIKWLHLKKSESCYDHYNNHQLILTQAFWLVNSLPSPFVTENEITTLVYHLGLPWWCSG